MTELWAGKLVNVDSIPGRDRYFSLQCNVHTGSMAHLTSYSMVTTGFIPGGKVAAAAAMKLTTDQECGGLLIHSHYVFMAWCFSKPSLLTNLRQVWPWKVCNYTAGQETPCLKGSDGTLPCSYVYHFILFWACSISFQNFTSYYLKSHFNTILPLVSISPM